MFLNLYFHSYLLVFLINSNTSINAISVLMSKERSDLQEELVRRTTALADAVRYVRTYIHTYIHTSSMWLLYSYFKIFQKLILNKYFGFVFFHFRGLV